MATITQQQLRQILQKAPAGTTPQGIINAMQAQGHEIEGITTPSIKPRLIEAPEAEVEQPGVFGRVKQFIGEQFAGRIRKDRGFVGEVVESTVGSRGLLGAVQTPILAAVQGAEALGFKTGFDISETQKGLAQSQQGLADRTTELIKLARTEADPTRKAQLERTIQSNLQILRGGQEAQQELQEFGRTPKQALGISATAASLVAAPAIFGQATALGRVGLGALLGVSETASFAAARDEDISKEELAVGAAVGAAVPLIGPAFRAAGKLTGKALGITTGVGSEAIEQAFKNPTDPSFVSALRGTKTVNSILTDARDVLAQLKEQRGAAYRKTLDKLGLGKKELSILPIKEEAATQANNFNIKIVNGEPDFSQSKIAATADQDDIRGLVRSIARWTDDSAAGLDILKQRLDDIYSQSSGVRAYVAAVRGAVKKELNKVKGYEGLTKDYREATELIKEIEAAFSLRTGTSSDTAIRKLTNSLNRNEDFRRDLLKLMQEATGVDLTGALSGATLNKIEPRGLARYLVGAEILAAFVNPALLIKMLVALGFSSPRLVGEAVRGAGLVKQITGVAVKKVGLGKIFEGGVAPLAIPAGVVGLRGIIPQD